MSFKTFLIKKKKEADHDEMKMVRSSQFLHEPVSGTVIYF